MGLAGVAIALGGGTSAAVWTYDASWLLSVLLARQAWRRASAGMGDEQASREQLRAALRFGAPRAPSALLAQALFWADLWVLAHYRGGDAVDIYSAVGRIAQVVLLFLTSFNLLFSPFAADLHARGERAMLDALFKRATRWALMGTIPAVIVLAVAAVPALQVYGHGYADGSTALRILLAGQLANVATGSVGFVLIMVGRTRLDLVDNALGVALLVALAAPLSSAYGINGTAVAAAITLAGVNALRLAQVHRYVGIQPYEGAYARLLPATVACAVAAVAAHLLTMDLRPFTDLVATCAAGIGVYLLLLPSAVSADERAALGSLTRRITQRGSR
jgi:O-antigen/teichoic acid export membrane protein